MDTSDFFPKSTPSQNCHCQLSIIDVLQFVLKSQLEPFKTVMEPIGANWNQSSHIKKGILILKRNTHLKKEYSSKMEHSYYYQKKKWNTHQTWNSLNRNIHIKMEHLSKWNPHIVKMELIK